MEDQLIMINVELKNLDFVAVYFAKGCSLLSNHFLHLYRNILEAAHRLKMFNY